MTDIYEAVQETVKVLGPDISKAMEQMQTNVIYNKEALKSQKLVFLLCGQGSAEWHKQNNMDFVYLPMKASNLLSTEKGIISDIVADVLAHLELDAIAVYGPSNLFVPINLKRYTQSSAGKIEDEEAEQIIKQWNEGDSDDPYAY